MILYTILLLLYGAIVSGISNLTLGSLFFPHLAHILFPFLATQRCRPVAPPAALPIGTDQPPSSSGERVGDPVPPSRGAAWVGALGLPDRIRPITFQK